jgi:hypothetical protein
MSKERKTIHPIPRNSFAMGAIEPVITFPSPDVLHPDAYESERSKNAPVEEGGQIQQHI